MTNPPFLRPKNWWVSIRKALAFPSKCVKSSHSIEERCDFNAKPFPSEKYVEIAFSPECPKGGFPKSCARHAAETIEGISDMYESFNSGCLDNNCKETELPKERPTQDTSKL